MKLYFQCSECGEYPVDEQTFEAVIGPALKEKLEERRSHGHVAVAAVEFIDGCIRCKPNCEHKIQLKVSADEPE